MSNSHLLEWEYDVFEIFVHGFHEVVDELEVGHFVFLVLVDADDEVEGGVASVDDFVAAVFEEAALIFIPGETLPDEFALEGESFLDGEEGEVLGESGLALLVDHEDEVDHLNNAFDQIKLIVSFMEMLFARNKIINKFMCAFNT